MYPVSVILCLPITLHRRAFRGVREIGVEIEWTVGSRFRYEDISQIVRHVLRLLHLPEEYGITVFRILSDTLRSLSSVRTAYVAGSVAYYVDS